MACLSDKLPACVLQDIILSLININTESQHQLYTNVHRLASHDCGLYIFIASVASAEHLVADFPSWSSSEASTWSATKYAIGSVGSSY